jgi:hypothetical protein
LLPNRSQHKPYRCAGAWTSAIDWAHA